MKKRKNLLLAVAVFCITTVISVEASEPKAQGEMKIMKFEKDKVSILQEIGAIVISENDKLLVEFVPPSNERTAEYKSVDIQSGDVLLMLNGKSLSSTKQLNEGYEILKIGADVKFGVKRDDQILVVSYPKADNENQSGNMQTIMHIGSDDSPTGGDGQVMQMKTITIDDPDKTIVLKEAGLILKEKDGEIIVSTILPNDSNLSNGVTANDGDFVVSIQGNKVSSIKKFSKIFNKIPVGELVNLKLMQNGIEVSTNFEKKNDQSDMKLIKKMKTN